MTESKIYRPKSAETIRAREGEARTRYRAFQRKPTRRTRNRARKAIARLRMARSHWGWAICRPKDAPPILVQFAIDTEAIN